MIKEKQPQLCYGCHLETKQQFNRAFHHRVNEGMVQCSDCHNPHGGFLTRQLRATASQDLVCYKCHSDKAGPFVYEHETAKIEGGLPGPTPHASTTATLLHPAHPTHSLLSSHPPP